MWISIHVTLSDCNMSACFVSSCTAETVRAMTHVINQGMAMYWGTSRWSPMEIMVRLCVKNLTHHVYLVHIFLLRLEDFALPYPAFPFHYIIYTDHVLHMGLNLSYSLFWWFLLGSILCGKTVQPNSSHLWAGWVPHVPEREGRGTATWALP